MSRTTLRIFVVLSICSIAGIILTQAFWFRKSFEQSQQTFATSLNHALSEAAAGILAYNNRGKLQQDPVQKLEHNYYAVMVNDQINTQVLEYYLKACFRKYNIDLSYEYSIYDCENRRIVYGGHVSGTDEKRSSVNRPAGGAGVDNYYFTVYFPYKTAGIIAQMGLALYASIVLFVVLIFFAYSLFIVLRQKRLAEVQHDFINNMAHEFKTPVATISIAAETLKRPNIAEQPDRIKAYANVIHEESFRLRNQIERVLANARFEKQMKLNLERLNLEELIRNCSKRISEITHSKPVYIHDELQSTAWVNGDRFHLENLFSNLLDNAIKYSGDKVNITLKDHIKNKHVEIWVNDDGIGISGVDQKRIFERFYRVSTGNLHDTKGFGLGLSYAKMVANSHRGSLEVHSELNKGSSFKITLPLI